MKTSKCRGILAILCVAMILCSCKAEERQTTVLETFPPLAQNQFFETEKLPAKKLKPWDLAIYIKSNDGQQGQLLTTLEGFTGWTFQSEDGKKLLLSVNVGDSVDDYKVDFLYIDGSVGTLERPFPAMTTFRFIADDTGAAVIAAGKLVDGIFTSSRDYKGTLYDTKKGKAVQEIDLEIPETGIPTDIIEISYDATENKFIILMGEMMDIYLERELYLSEDRSKIVRMEKMDYEKPIAMPPRNLEKKFTPLQEGQTLTFDFNDRTGILLVSVNGDGETPPVQVGQCGVCANRNKWEQGVFPPPGGKYQADMEDRW